MAASINFCRVVPPAPDAEPRQTSAQRPPDRVQGKSNHVKRFNIGIMPYALGKCGLNYITELTAAQFAAAGIRANTLMLGPIDSTLGNTDSQSLFGFEPDEVDEAYAEVVKLKMGRASAWETGYAALYLLADESRFMTGQQIRLDGGATLVR